MFNLRITGALATLSNMFLNHFIVWDSTNQKKGRGGICSLRPLGVDPFPEGPWCTEKQTRCHKNCLPLEQMVKDLLRVSILILVNLFGIVLI